MSTVGRFVVFVTRAAAVPADTNGVADVYLRDTVAGTTTFASPPPAEGYLFEAEPRAVDVSDDGRYVAFTHGNSTTSYLHRYDRQTVVTTRYVGGEFVDLKMTGDANHFALNTGCFNVGGCFPEPVLFDVPGTTPTWGSPDTGSCASDEVRALSRDGQWVIWHSADRYDPLGQCADHGDYLMLRSAGASLPLHLPADAQVLDISRSSDAVLYFANGAALPGGDAARTNLYLLDRDNVTHNREDFTVAAQLPDADVTSAVLSPEGRSVAFVTRATNMVPDDSNGVDDVFVRPTGMR
jgi:hypothetical protein